VIVLWQVCSPPSCRTLILNFGLRPRDPQAPRVLGIHLVVCDVNSFLHSNVIRSYSVRIYVPARSLGFWLR